MKSMDNVIWKLDSMNDGQLDIGNGNENCWICMNNGQLDTENANHE